MLPEALGLGLRIFQIESHLGHQSSYHGPKGHWTASVSGAEFSLAAADYVLLQLAVAAVPVAQLHEILFVAVLNLLFGSFCVLCVC